MIIHIIFKLKEKGPAITQPCGQSELTLNNGTDSRRDQCMLNFVHPLPT